MLFENFVQLVHICNCCSRLKRRILEYFQKQGFNSDKGNSVHILIPNLSVTNNERATRVVIHSVLGPSTLGIRKITHDNWNLRKLCYNTNNIRDVILPLISSESAHPITPIPVETTFLRFVHFFAGMPIQSNPIDHNHRLSISITSIDWIVIYLIDWIYFHRFLSIFFVACCCCSYNQTTLLVYCQKPH